MSSKHPAKIRRFITGIHTTRLSSHQEEKEGDMNPKMPKSRFMYRYSVPIIGTLTALLLVACGGGPPGASPDAAEDGTDEAQQDIATSNGRVVSATGEVFPQQYATLSFEIDGQVIVLEVEEGQTVQEGDLIASLETRNLEAALAQAEAGVAVAEAQLEEAKAGPRPEEIAAAAQQVSAAQARIEAAENRREFLFTDITEEEILAAGDELSRAQLALEDAQEAMDTLLYNASVTDQSEFDYARGDINPISAGEGLAEQIALSELSLQLAQAEFDDLLDGPDQDRVAVEEARIAAATAQRDAAAARLQLLQAQPFEDQIAISEAGVVEAEARLVDAQARLRQAQIFAPFSGTITDVFIDEGEFISPGDAVIEMGALDTLRVETTDLNELDVAQISVGSAVDVTFDAIPDEVTGTVTLISPKAEEGTGVNYTTIIELEELPENLRWGMTAFVDIETSDEGPSFNNGSSDDTSEDEGEEE